MMDEQAIRRWVYDKLWGGCLTVDGELKIMTQGETMRYADFLAAWVMSGKLPDKEPTA